MELIDFDRHEAQASFRYLQQRSAAQELGGQFSFRQKYTVLRGLFKEPGILAVSPANQSSIVAIASEPAVISAVMSLVPAGAAVKFISRKISDTHIYAANHAASQKEDVSIHLLQCDYTRKQMQNVALAMPGQAACVYFLDPDMQPDELFEIASSTEALLRGRNPGNSLVLAFSDPTDFNIAKGSIRLTMEEGARQPLQSFTTVTTVGSQFNDGWVVDNGNKAFGHVLVLHNISIH